MQRVLIVDDSALFRRHISAALIGQQGIDVMGTAANGRLALDLLREGTVDIAVVDLEMPEMSGLELLDEMLRLSLKTKTIVFASGTKGSALASLKALNRGAFDFVLKPTETGGDPQSPAERIRSVLLPKIRLAESSRINMPSRPIENRWPTVDVAAMSPSAVVIGCSTGGPNALEEIFGSFGGNFGLPMLIVQHMPPVFTAALAERLSAISGLPAREGVHGEVIKAGHILVAPGDFHMRVIRDGGENRVALNQNEKRQSVRPAVNELFESAAEVYGRGLLAAILTGMGEDGREGAIRVKERGGAVVTQEGASCIVNGMPRAVLESGACDRVMSLVQIRERLQKLGRK